MTSRLPEIDIAWVSIGQPANHLPRVDSWKGVAAVAAVFGARALLRNHVKIYRRFERAVRRKMKSTVVSVGVYGGLGALYYASTKEEVFLPVPGPAFLAAVRRVEGRAAALGLLGAATLAAGAAAGYLIYDGYRTTYMEMLEELAVRRPGVGADEDEEGVAETARVRRLADVLALVCKHAGSLDVRDVVCIERVCRATYWALRDDVTVWFELCRRHDLGVDLVHFDGPDTWIEVGQPASRPWRRVAIERQRMDEPFDPTRFSESEMMIDVVERIVPGSRTPDVSRAKAPPLALTGEVQLAAYINVPHVCDLRTNLRALIRDEEPPADRSNTVLVTTVRDVRLHDCCSDVREGGLVHFSPRVALSTRDSLTLMEYRAEMAGGSPFLMSAIVRMERRAGGVEYTYEVHLENRLSNRSCLAKERVIVSADVHPSSPTDAYEVDVVDIDTNSAGWATYSPETSSVDWIVPEAASASAVLRFRVRTSDSSVETLEDEEETLADGVVVRGQPFPSAWVRSPRMVTIAFSETERGCGSGILVRALKVRSGGANTTKWIRYNVEARPGDFGQRIHLL